jgi:hypothetical protein
MPEKVPDPFFNGLLNQFLGNYINCGNDYFEGCLAAAAALAVSPIWDIRRIAAGFPCLPKHINLICHRI